MARVILDRPITLNSADDFIKHDLGRFWGVLQGVIDAGWEPTVLLSEGVIVVTLDVIRKVARCEHTALRHGDLIEAIIHTPYSLKFRAGCGGCGEHYEYCIVQMVR